MTVRELIAVLRQLPPEVEVYTSWDDGLGGCAVEPEQIGMGIDEDGQQYVVLAEPDGFRKGEKPVSASMAEKTDTALTIPGRWIGEVATDPEPLPNGAERLTLSLVVPGGKAQEVAASVAMARMADVGALPISMSVFGWVADEGGGE